MTSQPTATAAILLAALLAGCGAPADPAGNTAGAVAATPANAAAPAPPPPAPANTAAPAADHATAEAEGPALVIEGEGLRYVLDNGAARPIPFGVERALVERVLSSRGRPQRARLAECGEGPLDSATYPDGLQILYQDGKFAGWGIDGKGRSGLTTMTGLGIGSTRADLDRDYDAKVEESSIGHEFFVGGIGGLLDGMRPDSRVTHLWAGASCIFR